MIPFAILATGGLIGLLVHLIVFCIIAGLIWYLLSLLPIQQPWINIVRILFILICVLVILEYVPL